MNALGKSSSTQSASKKAQTIGRQAFFQALLTQEAVHRQGVHHAEPSDFFLHLVTFKGQPTSGPAKLKKQIAAKKLGADAQLVKPAAQVQVGEPLAQNEKQAQVALAPDSLEQDEQSPRSWSSRLSQGLSKTRSRLVAQLSGLLSSGSKIDEALLEEIENELLSADVGIEATDRILDRLREILNNDPTALNDDLLYACLATEMERILDVPGANPLVEPLTHKPFVLMVVGVNGVGKTTTIGKIAKHQTDMGRKVMLAAGDTFRAAATEQLKTWGERLSVPVIAQQAGADSASVVFDAFNAAKARGVDLLIADTAGRLHTKDHLMDELKKVKRVAQKIDPLAPHATLLVLDAGNGQNALNQAKVFHEAVQVSGIALTKLDGTARGGISFAICETLGLPLWFIGVGEQADDLRPFSAKVFVQALLKR